MSLVEVVLRVAPEHEEAAVAHLLEFSPGGFRHDDLDGGGAEFGVFVEASQSSAVQPYLAGAGVPVEHSHVVIVPEDYAERWKEFHEAVTIGGLWIGPPWQEESAPPAHKRVVIEPGQGFGTGAHPTTRLMLTLLLEQPRASLLDIGCGSGVLAIAAVMCGFRPVTAIDNDPLAVDSTRENLERNGVEGVRVSVLDALTHQLPTADVVLANLTLEPLRALAPRLTAPRVVASGLLRSQVEAATAAFEESGYVVRERRDRDGWAAIVLDNTREDRSTMYQRDVF